MYWVESLTGSKELGSLFFRVDLKGWFLDLARCVIGGVMWGVGGKCSLDLVVKF